MDIFATRFGVSIYLYLQQNVIFCHEKHHVLFAYRDNEVAGVIHFSDYNRNPVFVKIYALLLEFEKKYF